MNNVDPQEHPLLVAVRPLLERVGGELVEPDALVGDDVPLVWDGAVLAGVRLTPLERASDLTLILTRLTDELGGDLQALDRAGRQNAVRLLEARGAFNYRKSVETVAEVLGVTRFTVYNYLNRDRSA
ncbi:MAG: helix-turn-helix domain-containing protein [Mycobacteriaceae bacterium]